jgi:hypothetical protein
VHHGEGLTFEVNYGRHIWGEGFTRLTFEVPAVFNLDEDLNYAANSVPASYQSYFVTPSLRANIFAVTAVSPWISAGGGFGHFNPANHLEFGGPSGAKSTTSGVMQIGIGLDIRLKQRFRSAAKPATSGQECPISFSILARLVSTIIWWAAALSGVSASSALLLAPGGSQFLV